VSPEALFAQYLPVAEKIAHGFMRSLPQSVQLDDVRAAAHLGLWQAVNANSEREGFRWYVRVRVRGAIIDELRTEDWLPRRARQRAVERGEAAAVVIRMGDLGAPEREGLSFAAPPDSELEREQALGRLEAMIDRLPTRERQILRALLDGKSQQIIADELRVSCPRVSQLRKRAIARLRGKRTARWPRPPRKKA